MKAMRSTLLTKKEQRRQNLKKSTAATVKSTSTNETEFPVHLRMSSESHIQMRQRLKDAKKTANRFALSSVADAAIAIQDFRIIKGCDTAIVIVRGGVH